MSSLDVRWKPGTESEEWKMNGCGQTGAGDGEQRETSPRHTVR